MTSKERLELLKQIEKDIHVCSLESTFLEDAKSCAIHSAIEELEQEPKSEWEHDHEILKAYADGANNVLEKVRAEIADTLYVDSLIFGELIDFKNGKISADDVIEEFNRVTRMEILHIIDKYRTESEE